ncbi:MAG TPA: hypothetical protein VIF57_25230 [Polyangia bacterium]|jgi:hypothetical protein
MGSQVVALALALFFAAPGGAALPRPDPAAIAAVKTWLAALGAKNPAKLRAASVVPFTYVTHGQRKRCDGVAADDKALGKILKCMVRAEKLLIGELRHLDEVVLQGAEGGGAQPIDSYPSYLGDLVGTLDATEGHATVSGYINGDGETFEFVFAVRPDGKGFKVSGLALHWEMVE